MGDIELGALESAGHRLAALGERLRQGPWMLRTLVAALVAAILAAGAAAPVFAAAAPSGLTPHGVAFVDPTQGWVVGGAAAGGPQDGFALSTSDGGRSWTQETLPAGAGDLQSVAFVDRLQGWAAGGADVSGQATLLATVDGGQTWRAAAAPGSLASIDDVFFVDGRDGWLSGETVPDSDGRSRGRLFVTHDRGLTWVEEGVAGAPELLRVRFADPRHGIAITRGGLVFRTSDGGGSWQGSRAGLVDLEAVALPAPGRAVVAGLAVLPGGGTAGAIATSADGGQTWTRAVLAAGTPLVSALSFNGAQSGFAVGSSSSHSVVMTTRDGGATWSPAAGATSDALLGVVALDGGGRALTVGWRFTGGAYQAVVGEVSEGRGSSRTLTIHSHFAPGVFHGPAAGAGLGGAPASAPLPLLPPLGLAVTLAVAAAMLVAWVHRRRLRPTALVVATVVGLGLTLASPSGALATGDTVLVNGHDWLYGRGATVFANTYACCGTHSYLAAGSNGDTQPSHNSADGTYVGVSYQCVELAQRTYFVLGWYGGSFGQECASEIFGWASSHNFVTGSSGDGTLPVPGDLIVQSGGDPCDDSSGALVGHVSVVTSVTSTNVNVVEQNANPAGTDTFTRSGTNGSLLTGTYVHETVLGYVHSPKNDLTQRMSPNTASQLTDWSANRLDDFTQGSSAQNFALEHNAWANGSWVFDMPGAGGVLGAAPVVVSRGQGLLDVVVQGTGHTINHIGYNGTSWSAWENILNGAMDFRPAVVTGGPHALDVFVAGYPNHHLYHAWWDGSQWGGWEDLNGIGTGTVPSSISSSPSAVVWGPNRIDVFAASSTGSLAHVAWTGSSWIWDDLGGQIVGDPSAITRGQGLLDVVVQGTGHNVDHIGFNGTSWSPWENILNGLIDFSPAVVSGGPHTLDVFAAGYPNHDLYHAWWNGSQWGGWEDLTAQGGGSPTSIIASPSAVARTSTTIDVTADASVNGTQVRKHLAWTGAQWIWDSLTYQ